MSTQSPRRRRPAFLAAALLLATLLPAAPVLAQSSVTARGNEPFWQLEISDQAMTFQTLDGEVVRVSPVPPPISSNHVELYLATADGKPFAAVLADKLCVDSMSGMPFPQTAIVVRGADQFTGCGGIPASLLHGDWQVDEIGGTPVVAKSEPTLGFSPDGSIHGNASCNRFFGTFNLTGEGLSLTSGGASMMACDQPLMEQESKLLAALGTVHRFDIDPRGDLLLLGGDDKPVLRLSK